MTELEGMVSLMRRFFSNLRQGRRNPHKLMDIDEKSTMVPLVRDLMEQIYQSRGRCCDGSLYTENGFLTESVDTSLDEIRSTYPDGRQGQLLVFPPSCFSSFPIDGPREKVAPYPAVQDQNAWCLETAAELIPGRRRIWSVRRFT